MKIPGMTPKYELAREDKGWRVTVTAPSFMGASPSSLYLTDDQKQRFDEWQNNGGYVQDLLSDLSASEREVLLTGLGPDDWGRMFEDDE